MHVQACIVCIILVSAEIRVKLWPGCSACSMSLLYKTGVLARLVSICVMDVHVQFSVVRKSSSSLQQHVHDARQIDKLQMTSRL